MTEFLFAVRNAIRSLNLKEHRQQQPRNRYQQLASRIFEGPYLKISSAATQPNTQAWWVPVRRLDDEMLDREQPFGDLKENFRDIETINRLFGGWSLVLKHVSPFLESGDASILNVATGGADVPRAILRWSRKKDRKISISAVDSSAVVLDIAREATRGEPAISLLEGDARQLPFADNSFDLVLLSLTLHHFDDATAERVLREIMRVAKRGIIVNDLSRAYLPAGLIWLTTRLLGMNRMTKNDAPLSVLRARTPDEYRRLAECAGLQHATICKHAFWRVAVVASKGS